MQAVARKKKEHFALERGAITSDRPRLMLLEQIIDHSVKNNFMSDDEIRDEIYTLFTAVSLQKIFKIFEMFLTFLFVSFVYRLRIQQR